MPTVIVTNAKQLAVRMQRRAQALEPAQYVASREIAERLTKDSRGDLVEDVYSQPPKTTKTGKQKWRRTGQLLQNERWALRGQGAGRRATIVHENRTPYAAARLAYGKPGGRKASPPQRPWRGPAVVLQRNRAWILARRRRALQAALRSA